MLHHQDIHEEVTLLNSEMQNLQKFKILDFFETKDLGFNTLLNYFPYRNQEDLDTNCLGFLYGPEAYTEGLYSSFYTPTLDDDQSELIIGLYAQLAPQLLEFLHEYGGKKAGVKWSNYNRLEKKLVEEAHDFFAIAADFVSADYVKYRPYDFIDQQCNYSVELIFNAMANVLLETPVGQVIRRWLHARLQWLNEYPFKPLPKDPEAELARLEKLIDEFDPRTDKALRYEKACVTWQEVLKADVRPVLEGNFSSKQQIYTHLFSRLPWLGNYLSQLFYVVVNAAGIKHPEHQRFLGKLADEFAKFCIWAPASLWCRAFQVELAVDPEIKKFLESCTPAYSKDSDLAPQAPAPAQVNPNSLQRKGKQNKHQGKSHERKNQTKPAYMQAFARSAAKDPASDDFAAQASGQLDQGNTNTHTKANPATKAKKPKGQLGFSLEQALQAATLFNRQPPLPKRAYPNSLLTAGLKAESLLCAGASNHIDVPTDPELYQAPLTEEHPFISHLCFSFPLLESSHKQVQEWTAELNDPARQLEEAYNFCLSLDQTESTTQSSHSAGPTTSDSTNQPGQPEQEPQSQNQAGSDKPLSKSAQAFRHAVLMAAIDHPVWLHVNTNAQVSGVGRGQKSWLMRPGSDFANTSLYTGIIGSLNPALMANFAGSLRDQISFTQDQILTHILDQAHDNIFVHANRQAKRELYEWYSDEPAERVTNRQIRALQKDYDELSAHIKGMFRDARGKLVIKWPNDIYLLPADYVNDNSSSDKHKSGNNHYHTNLQKVSGLLAQKDKYLMCSFGLNVLPSAIKEGLHTNATFNYRALSSLIPLFILARKRTGKTFDRLLNEIAQLRNDLVAQEPEYALLPEWIKQNFGLTGQREGKQGDKGAKVKEAKVKEAKVDKEEKVGKETNQGKNKAKGNENLTYAQAVKLAHKLDNEHLADYLKGHRYFEAACAYFNNLGLTPDILQKHKVKAELQTELARLNKIARQGKLSTEFVDKSGLKVEGFALPKFNPALKDSPLISLMFKIFEICGCQTKVESFPYATLLPALYPAPFRFLSVHQVFKELYLLTMRCTEALSTTRSELDLSLPDLVAEANANANKAASAQAKASAETQDDATDATEASNVSLESLFQAWKNSLKERFPAFLSPDYQKHALYQVGAKVRTSDDQGKPLVGTVVGYNQYGWLELEPTTATEPTVEHAAKAEQDTVKPAAQPVQNQATYQLTSPRSIRGINAKDYTVFSFDYKTILEANQVDAKLDD